MTVLNPSSKRTPLDAEQKTVVVRQGGIFNAGNSFSFISVVLTLAAIPFLPVGKTSLFGLLASGTGGLLVLAAVLCAVTAVAVGLYQRRYAATWVALFVTIFAFRIPTVFSSGYPMYGWTYKHLGVVDYIQQYGNVATSVDIYYSWPAMFALVAWFGTITGIPAIVLAEWFIVFIHVAQAVAVYGLARSLARSKYQALAAAFVAEILNWIGQDYFSPQALGFVLACIVLTLLFQARRRPWLAWVSVPIFFALVITHQLTPYWVCIVVFFGCVFKFIRPRYMFIIYGLIAVGWMALNFHALARYGLFSGFDPLSNAERPSLGASVFARTVTETAMKGTAALTWGTAAVTGLVLFFRSRNRKVDALMPLILTFSSFVLLGGQNYGGEAIFRVLLYSLPGASILIGTLLVKLLTRRAERPVRSGFKFVIAWTALILVTTVSLQAQYGTWFANRITKDSVVVSNQMLTNLPLGSYNLGMLPAGPGRQIAKYVAAAEANYAYDATLTGMNPDLIGESFKTTAAENALTIELQDLNKPVTLTWSPQMQTYSDYYGIFPQGAVQRLVKQLKKDDRWELIVKKNDILVFELKGSI